MKQKLQKKEQKIGDSILLGIYEENCLLFLCSKEKIKKVAFGNKKDTKGQKSDTV